MCDYILQHSECRNVNTIKMSNEMHKFRYCASDRVFNFERHANQGNL